MKKYRMLIVLVLLLLLVIAGCKGKKKPAAPEPLKPEDYAKLTPEQEIAQEQEKLAQAVNESIAACQKQGGINCQGCCKNPIFSSNVLTCCSPVNESCIERIQFQAVFDGLGNVTIERFPNGNYGVWYGEKDETFGNRLFVDAEKIDKNTYKFIIDGREYQFTITEFGCGISTKKPSDEADDKTTYHFVFVPLDNSWKNNQQFFEQKSKDRAIFFQDISKFKFENVKFIYVPIEYANSNCDVLNFGNLDKKSHQKLKNCADKYTQSLGIGYERAIGFVNAFPDGEGERPAGTAFFGNKVVWTSRGGIFNTQQVDFPAIVPHELGHTYNLCDESKYSLYVRNNKDLNGGCKNKWPEQCPKNDNEICLGNTPTFRDYSGPSLSGVCEGKIYYSVMSNSHSSTCGYDNTGGYEAVGPTQPAPEVEEEEKKEEPIQQSDTGE